MRAMTCRAKIYNNNMTFKGVTDLKWPAPNSYQFLGMQAQGLIRFGVGPFQKCQMSV